MGYMGVYVLVGRKTSKEMGCWTGMEVPMEFYALHYDEVHREFYNDGEEPQVCERGKDEN